MTDQAISAPEPATRAMAPTRRSGMPILVWIALCWLVAMVIIALFAETLAPYRYTAPDLRNRLSPPGHALHWLGRMNWAAMSFRGCLSRSRFRC